MSGKAHEVTWQRLQSKGRIRAPHCPPRPPPGLTGGRTHGVCIGSGSLTPHEGPVKPAEHGLPCTQTGAPPPPPQGLRQVSPQPSLTPSSEVTAQLQVYPRRHPARQSVGRGCLAHCVEKDAEAPSRLRGESSTTTTVPQWAPCLREGRWALLSCVLCGG